MCLLDVEYQMVRDRLPAGDALGHRHNAPHQILLDIMTHRVRLSDVMGQSRNPQTIEQRGRSAMATNCQFEGMQGKVLEAVAAFTQANERVVGQLVELSSTAALDAARAIPMPSAPTETLEDLRRDPFAWYRRGFQAVAESTQRAAKLIETNAKIVARNAERLQASTAASAKEIEQAASGYASRMKDIYTRA